MTCDMICWWQVSFSIGTSVSTRRDRLRCIQSADEMNTLAFLRWQAVAGAEADDARVLEEPADDALDPDVVRQPGTPGRRQQMPRTIRSIFTPAWTAS